MNRPSEATLLSSPGTLEMKHIDIAYVPANITTTLSSTWITASITGGSTAATRVGNVIHIKKIVVDMWVTSGNASNCIRAILAKCLNGQQGTPTLASWYLPIDGDAFFPLQERRLNISNSTSTAITKPLYMVQNFPGRGLKIHYDSASANTEISPRLQLCLVSDSAAATFPSAEGYIRVFYTDA